METFVGWRSRVFFFFIFFSTPIFIDCVTTDVNFSRQDGDVMLAALFEVSEATSDGACGDLDVNGLQSVFALQWFIQELNKANYIPGVKIGLEIRRTCYSQKRALDEAKAILDKYVSQCNDTAPPLFGVIGPSTTQTAINVTKLYSSQPEDKRIPLISGSATGTQLSSYANFFRVIPPDDTQVEVITDLLVALKWNYVAMVYTDEEYGISVANALRQRAEQKGICVPVFESVPKNTGSGEDATKLSTIAQKLNADEKSSTSRVRAAVFIGSKNRAGPFVNKLHENAKSVKIIFSEALGLQTSAVEEKTNGNVYDNAIGSLAVTPPYRPVQEFRDAWNASWKDCNSLPPTVTDNPWLDASKNECSSLTINDHEKLLYPWYYIQAASVFAAAMKSLHTQTCKNSSGPCLMFLTKARNYTRTNDELKRSRPWNLEDEFMNFTSSFSGMNGLTFDENGTLVAANSSKSLSRYEVHNLTTCGGSACFEKVANYTDGKLLLDKGRVEPWLSDHGQCMPGKNCISQCVDRNLGDFALVIEGDYYFVGVVPVHTKDKKDAFKCGEARGTLGADFAEAIRFALEEVNKPGGLWADAVVGNKTLGAIIFDSCYSELVIKFKLLNLHLGQVLTPHGLWHTESHVKDVILKNVVGYVGGFFSDVSIAMSEVLTELHKNLTPYVHLSPTSVANELSERNRHPYFMRLTRSANAEVKAILELLQHLSATYIQIIFNKEDQYSLDLLNMFKSDSADYKVCIAQTIYLNGNGNVNQGPYVLGEIRTQLHARIVIPILQFQEIDELMKRLIDDQLLAVTDNFVFIGTESWARKTEIIRGRDSNRKRLAGSITIAEEIDPVSEFDTFFKEADPLNTSNFWLRDYWEEKLSERGCFLERSFQRNGSRKVQCPDTYRNNYTQDQWIPFYIQAVYALASGVGNTINTKCSKEASFSKCNPTSKTIVEKMKEVKLDFFGKGKDKVFDANGDGKNSYKFMQAYWNSTTKQMEYRQIGSWTEKLSLFYDVSNLISKLPDSISPRNYVTACPNPTECIKCRTASESEQCTKEDLQLPLVPAAVALGVLGLLLIIFIIIAVVYMRRYRSSIKYLAQRSTNHELKFENDVLSSASSMTLSNAPTLSHVPVQEMYCRGSGPTGVAFQSQMYHHQRTDSADYATVVEAENALELPVPCRVKATANDYLTALGTPK